MPRPPITLATNDDGTPRLLEHHLAVSCDDPAQRRAVIGQILKSATASSASIYLVDAEHEDSASEITGEVAQDAAGLSGMLDALHDMVIERIKLARRIGNEAYELMDLPPVYLLVSGVTEMLRHPEEGEMEWFQQAELRTWALRRLVKLMSANRLAGITVVVADSLAGYDELSESSQGYELLMKTDALMIGGSTPQTRAGLLRVQPDEDDLGILPEDSVTYVDESWFHPVALLVETPAVPDTSAEQALYDALAPVLGITEDDDERLVGLARTVAEMIAQSGLEIPERIRDTYRRELLSAA